MSFSTGTISYHKISTNTKARKDFLSNKKRNFSSFYQWNDDVYSISLNLFLLMSIWIVNPFLSLNDNSFRSIQKELNSFLQELFYYSYLWIFYSNRSEWIATSYLLVLHRNNAILIFIKTNLLSNDLKTDKIVSTFLFSFLWKNLTRTLNYWNNDQKMRNSIA